MESRICLKNLFSTQWSDAHHCRKYLNFSSVCLFEKLWSKYKACMQRISQLLDNYTPYTFSFILNIFFHIRIERTKVNVSTCICKKKKILIARSRFVILISTNNLFEIKARFYVYILLIIESHEVCILLHTNSMSSWTSHACVKNVSFSEMNLYCLLDFSTSSSSQQPNGSYKVIKKD